jgi:hypothetical protein
LTITRREGSDGVGPHRFDPVSIATVGLVALDLPPHSQCGAVVDAEPASVRWRTTMSGSECDAVRRLVER